MAREHRIEVVLSDDELEQLDDLRGEATLWIGTRWFRILEEIIRDEETNATARCTAIRTLLEIAPREPSSGVWADLDELAPRRNSRTKAH